MPPTQLSRTTRLCMYFALIACLTMFTPATLSAQQATTERALAELLHPFYRNEFAKYDFHLADQAEQKLKLVDTPIMAWQGDGDWLGDVFLWTYQDRPQLVGCIGSWRATDHSRGVFHEFHTLAQQQLSAVTIGKKQMWSAAKGLQWEAVDSASSPAESASARSIQMRNIARELTVEMESESGTHELRLLPQPLYRYESKELGVVDGALFSYVWTNGTDPEFLLLVESRRQQGKDGWYYAPARLTYRSMTIKRDNSLLWQLDRHENDYQSLRLTTPYVTLRVENVQLVDLETAEEPATETP